MECFCPFLHWCTLTCGDESKVGFGENVSYLFLSEDESGKPIFFSYETVHSFAIGFSTFDIVAQQGYFVNVILCFSPNDIFFIVFILGPNSISTTDHKQWLERPKWPSHERVSKQPLLQTGKWISSSFFNCNTSQIQSCICLIFQREASYSVSWNTSKTPWVTVPDQPVSCWSRRLSETRDLFSPQMPF